MLVRPWTRAVRESCTTPRRLLRNRMLNELFHESVPVILHEDDLNAMYYSVENRSPYLDRDLFDWSQQIPTRHLVRDGRAKAVLRDAVRGHRARRGDRQSAQGRLQRSRCSTTSTCARTPVREELLADSPIFDIVRREPIEPLLERTELPNSQSKFLFYFLNAKLFLEEFAS